MSENKLVPNRRFKEFQDTDAWEQRKLDKITLKIGSGKTPRGGESSYALAGIPFLRSQNVYDNIICLNDVAYITPQTDEEMKNSRVVKNDVLLNITGASIGRSAVYRYSTSANVNQHVCIVRPIEDYSSDFIQLNLTSPSGQQQIDSNQAGGGREGLNFKQIGEMNFAFPNYKEQQEIGEFFKQLDNLITLHQRKLEKSKALKSAYLAEMFPAEGERVPKRRFSGFTSEWEKKRLGDISNSFSGGTPTAGNKLFYGGEIPFIRSGEVNSKNTGLFITEEGLKTSSAKLVSRGDILYALYGATSGEVGISQINGAINQAVLAIKPDHGNNAYFITQWLRKQKPFIIETYLQGGQGNLSGNIVKQLLIDLPQDKNEQKEIGEFFRKLDDTIRNNERKLKKLKAMKQAYLEEMFV